MTVTVPAGGARVYLATDGSLLTTSTAATGFSIVDVFLAVDGVEFANGAYQRVVAANTTGLVMKIEPWSMSTFAVVPAGDHTFSVRAIGAPQAGSADATVGGPNGSVLQGSLSVLIIKTQ